MGKTLAIIILTCFLTSCGNSSNTSDEKKNTEATALPAKARPGMEFAADVDWPMHGLTAHEHRYADLNQIDTTNVANLSLAWYLDLPEARGQESTPLIIDGVMYTSAAWSHVYAIDPATGEVLWHFDPKIDKANRIKGCCGPVNRGVAYADGKIFLGAFDGRLIALDAETGDQLWSTQTVDTNKNYTITGAPRIANGKVFIGNGGAEFGVRGYVTAYDQNTGKQVWRFYTVPGHPDKPQENPIHEKTKSGWSGEYWKLGGGGTAWDSMAVDPELNLLYIGVGNSSPWNPRLRTDGKGDNLFVSSIVALEIDTGKYAWHFQTTPQDAWDYTATQHMILTDLNIDGQSRKVIMQAPKNGYFYVLDRTNGEFISAENYVPVNWSSGLDENGRPQVNPEARYWDTGQPAVVTPAWSGGHNWHPMSYSKKTGLVYIPAQEMAFPYIDDTNFSPKKLAVNLGVDLPGAGFPDNTEVVKQIKDATKGHLSAWDPVTQKEVWRVQYPGMWNGGVLSTAGDLVFQGSATGYVNAYDARDGTKLWEFPAQTGVVAPPVTYRYKGEQYITVSAGWGGIYPLLTGPLASDSNNNPINRSRLLTFKLNGQASLPTPKDVLRNLPDFSEFASDETKVKQGLQVYERFCVSCHGTGAVGGGVVPDLRYSTSLADEKTWQTIVHDGALSSRGMVGFAAELSPEQIENARHYVIGRNQYARSIGDIRRLSR